MRPDPAAPSPEHPAASAFDAVIFDLDGVLVDSEIWWDEVRHGFAAAHDRPWTEGDRAAVMGANSRQWSATMRERLGLDMADAEIERAVVDGVVRRYREEGPPVIPGAVEAVRRIAARWRVAVASSAHREVIDAALGTLGIGDDFAVVVPSDDVARGKPAPDVYLEAARRLGVEPARCLVVEDSLNGVVAAREAGMTVVLVPNRSIPPADGARERAHLVVDAIAQVDPTAIESAVVPAPPPEPGPAPQPGPDAVAVGTSARRPAPPRDPADDLPLAGIPAWRRTLRYWIARVAVAFVARCIFRFQLEGFDRFPGRPAVYCFNHLSWLDPFVLFGTLPMRPRLYFFGPKEEDMNVGGRNRLMTWTGSAVPYRPGKNDLLGATRRVDAVLRSGGVIGIAGEGRIGHRESTMHPLSEGPAYFALRSGVPIVPIAINGTSWLRFGRRIRVRVGEPIPPEGRPTREAITALTRRTEEAMLALLADAPTLPPPGRIGRWFTELFNEWPEGSRPDTPEGSRPDAP